MNHPQNDLYVNTLSSSPPDTGPGVFLTSEVIRMLDFLSATYSLDIGINSVG